jgi:hypothetical protein
LFGVLAGCAASGSGGSGAGGGAGGGGGSNFTVQPPTHDFITPSVQQGIEDFFGFLSSVPVWIWVVLIVGLFVVGFILSILFLMVGSLGQAGVIKGTGMADAAKLDAPALSFDTIFNALKPHYWKVFLLQLGYRVAGFILTLILVVPIILLTICTCCLGLLLVFPIGWFINMLLDFTTIAIVEEALGIFEAIGRAWQVITRNLRASDRDVHNPGCGWFDRCPDHQHAAAHHHGAIGGKSSHDWRTFNHSRFGYNCAALLSLDTCVDLPGRGIACLYLSRLDADLPPTDA